MAGLSWSCVNGCIDASWPGLSCCSCCPFASSPSAMPSATWRFQCPKIRLQKVDLACKHVLAQEHLGQFEKSCSAHQRCPKAPPLPAHDLLGKAGSHSLQGGLQELESWPCADVASAGSVPQDPAANPHHKERKRLHVNQPRVSYGGNWHLQARSICGYTTQLAYLGVRIVDWALQ